MDYQREVCEILLFLLSVYYYLLKSSVSGAEGGLCVLYLVSKAFVDEVLLMFEYKTVRVNVSCAIVHFAELQIIL